MLSFKHPILKKISLVIFILVSSLTISFLFELIYYKQSESSFELSKNILPKQKLDNPYEIVALGNSHAENAINFDGFNINAKNFASVAQRFNYDLAILKHHKAEIAPNAIILINASPISFSHSTEFDEESFQQSYYKRISPIYIPELIVGNYLETVFFPFSRSGFHLRTLVKDRLTEKKSKDEFIQFNQNAKIKKADEQDQNNLVVKTKPELLKENSVLTSPLYIPMIEAKLISPASKPEDLENSVRFMVNKWTETNEFSPKFFNKNRKDLEKIISYSKKQGWRPIVITIPISALLIENLPDNFMEKNLYKNIEKTNLQGVDYIDFSQNYGLTHHTFWFSNSDHYKEEGSFAFSYVLLKSLIERKYLNENVSKYIPMSK